MVIDLKIILITKTPRVYAFIENCLIEQIFSKLIGGSALKPDSDVLFLTISVINFICKRNRYPSCFHESEKRTGLNSLGKADTDKLNDALLS